MGNHKQHNYYSVSGLLLLSKTHICTNKMSDRQIDRLIVIEQV